MLEAPFYLGGLALVYAYGGYGLVLGAIRDLRGERKLAASGFALGNEPAVTVLVCVHNEEANIAKRLDNLMAQDWPEGKMEVLVVSDGSTDGTEDIVRGYKGRFPVNLVISPRLGKSGAQNLAVPKATGEILVLTDAEAVFDKDFIKEIVAPYADPSVGCTTGKLGLMQRDGAISESQGIYWRYEQKLRRLESELGWLAVASGQCMALRKALYVDIPPFVGDDCFLPLAVVDQDKRVIHCEKARSYDAMEDEADREFASRVRMTMRNWTGTWFFPRLLCPWKKPGYAFALWSHKLLRWLGGPILGLVGLSAPFLLLEGGLTTLAALGVIIFFSFGLIGLREHQRGEQPEGFVGRIFSFLLVNAGFALGVWKGLTGQKIAAYKAGKMTEQKK